MHTTAVTQEALTVVFNVPTHLLSFIIAAGLQFSDVLTLDDNCWW